MIPASQPFEARYRHGEKGNFHYTTKRVVAWDNEGYPLVVGRDGCQLDRANSWSNFQDVGPVDSAVVAALPGAGWLAEYREDDGGLTTSPVVAWLVHADGSLNPMDTEPGGLVEDPTTVGNFIRIYHPDHPNS